MGHAARYLVGSVIAAGVARAEPSAEPAATLRAAVELGLHAPRTLALDGWLALNERLTLGLTTSHAARRALGAGRGLCVARCADRLPLSPPADDPYRYAGLAAEAQLHVAPNVTGRTAIDTTRFAPTVAALELGLDVRWRSGAWSAIGSPVLRVGLTRRDLDANRDTGALTGELDRRLWCTGGIAVLARGELALDALRGTPSLGAAAGAWLEVGDLVLAIRAGTAEVARTTARAAVFTEIALAWSR